MSLAERDCVVEREFNPCVRAGAPYVAWRVIQVFVWIVGLGIFGALIFWPEIGIHAFWNVLIPVAPALLAFATGFWRNICPLASTALFARHAGLSSRRKMSPVWQTRLFAAGVVLLFLIVPLRHTVMNRSGQATALCIGVLAIAAVILGRLFEWKSGWCSVLCPVHPVERLYGPATIFSPPNAHCDACQRCMERCPDSLAESLRPPERYSPAGQLAFALLIGGFPGFVWGWFHIPDYSGAEGWAHLGTTYGLPFAGAALTLGAFVILWKSAPKRLYRLLIRSFAALAIGCYYWYRLPALFGFGLFPGDGMLIDLTGALPHWLPIASQVATSLLFTWWLVGRVNSSRPWTRRPPYVRRDVPPATAGMRFLDRLPEAPEVAAVSVHLPPVMRD